MFYVKIRHYRNSGRPNGCAVVEREECDDLAYETYADRCGLHGPYATREEAEAAQWPLYNQKVCTDAQGYEQWA